MPSIAQRVPSLYLVIDNLPPVAICESCRGVLLAGEGAVCDECRGATVADHAHVLLSMFGGRVCAAVLTAGLLAGTLLTAPSAAWAQSGDSSWASSYAHEESAQGGGSPTLAPTPTPVYVPLRPVAESTERNLAL